MLACCPDTIALAISPQRIRTRIAAAQGLSGGEAHSAKLAVPAQGEPQPLAISVGRVRVSRLQINVGVKERNGDVRLSRLANGANAHRKTCLELGTDSADCCEVYRLHGPSHDALRSHAAEEACPKLRGIACECLHRQRAPGLKARFVLQQPDVPSAALPSRAAQDLHGDERMAVVPAGAVHKRRARCQVRGRKPHGAVNVQ
jgi:hypothetical protein